MKLTVDGCRDRQKRLLEVLEEKNLDGAIIARRDHVYYFTGFLWGRYHAAAAYIQRNGSVTLVCAGEPDSVAADEVITYQSAFHATMHSRQYEAVADALAPGIRLSGKHGADQGGGVSWIINLGGSQVADLTRDIYRLRKRKLPDEVDSIRDAIRISEVMYDTAKKIVHPGADELDVFAEIHAAAVRAAGGDLEDFGNDFRANSPGGAPRRRAMRAGELYIIDAGPSLDGYFADNCRTFAVDASPTDAQMKAWLHINNLFPILEAVVKPGVKSADIYHIADELLSEDGYNGLAHHLGHGFGMAPHETPELNPHYDAVFEIGDVFTMEPGLYSDELKAGIRLEENYLLSENGLKQLTSFPRELA